MSKKIKYSLDLFIDQFVEIITTVQITAVYTTEEGMSEKSKPLVVNGTFLGHDEDNVFIGDEEGSLSDSISKSQIVNIGIAKSVDKYDDLLDSANNNGNFNS